MANHRWLGKVEIDISSVIDCAIGNIGGESGEGGAIYSNGKCCGRVCQKLQLGQGGW